MDHVTVKFTCEKCGLAQEVKLTWIKTGFVKPATNDRAKATTSCKKCGHQQTIPVR